MWFIAAFVIPPMLAFVVVITMVCMAMHDIAVTVTIPMHVTVKDRRVAFDPTLFFIVIHFIGNRTCDANRDQTHKQAINVVFGHCGW